MEKESVNKTIAAAIKDTYMREQILLQSYLLLLGVKNIQKR